MFVFVVGVRVCAGVVGNVVGGGASVLGFGVGGVGDVVIDFGVGTVAGGVNCFVLVLLIELVLALCTVGLGAVCRCCCGHRCWR